MGMQRSIAVLLIAVAATLPLYVDGLYSTRGPVKLLDPQAFRDQVKVSD